MTPWNNARLTYNEVSDGDPALGPVLVIVGELKSNEQVAKA